MTTERRRQRVADPPRRATRASSCSPRSRAIATRCTTTKPPPRSRFGGIIVQGGVTSALLNALVAEDLPGPGSVFLNVNWASRPRCDPATRSPPKRSSRRCIGDKADLDAAHDDHQPGRHRGPRRNSDRLPHPAVAGCGRASARRRHEFFDVDVDVDVDHVAREIQGASAWCSPEREGCGENRDRRTGGQGVTEANGERVASGIGQPLSVGTELRRHREGGAGRFLDGMGRLRRQPCRSHRSRRCGSRC